MSIKRNGFLVNYMEQEFDLFDANYQAEKNCLLRRKDMTLPDTNETSTTNPCSFEIVNSE